MDILSITNFENLIIGVAGGLAVILIQWIWRQNKRSSLQESLQYLEWEKQYFNEILKSSVALNRNSFRSIFYILLFIGIANIISVVFRNANDIYIKYIGEALEMTAWSVVVFRSWKLFKLYSSFKNHKDTLEYMDNKIQSIRKNLTEINKK